MLAGGAGRVGAQRDLRPEARPEQVLPALLATRVTSETPSPPPGMVGSFLMLLLVCSRAFRFSLPMGHV